jgi:uncharacterized protein (UPF0147 family)
MTMNNDLDLILHNLEELGQDTAVPKNVKIKLKEIISILQGESEESIKIDKVMHIFESFSDDSNIDSFTRTQLWNVVSMLESL